MITKEQIDEITNIIDFQSNYFIAGNLSEKFLSHKDKLFLTKLGIDYRSPIKGLTPFQQAYYFGRLVSILGPLKSKEIDLDNFKKYLRRGQFHPLSEKEKKTLEYLEEKTFTHITNLTTRIKTTIVDKIKEVELINREQYEKIISDSVKTAVLEKRVVSDIVSFIGHKTKDWERDLGRIAETELQDAFEYGKVTAFRERYGDQGKYYKHVYGGACRHCVRLYLKNGIGSEPRLFTYNTLWKNGNNIGRKVDDWKPVIGTTHPYCRCDLRYVRPGDVWDKDKKLFLPISKKIPGDIKISIGDKKFIV